MPKVTERFDALLGSTDLSQLGADPSISQFWKEQIAKARAKAEAEAPPGGLRLADVIRHMGYGFQPLPDGVAVEQDPALVDVLDKWTNHTLPLLRKAGPKGVGLTADGWEHLNAVAYLQRENLLPAFLDFIRPFRIRSDMSTIRHFCYARVIRSLCDAHLSPRPLDVLEIGAGAGNQALFLMAQGLVAHYVIVDLPEMLLNAAVHLRDHRPDLDLHHDEFPDLAAPAGQAPAVYLVKTFDIAKLPAASVDLALNFNSFMEMTRATRDFYIDQVYRLARHGAIFYNVNRRQPRLPESEGTFFDSNPLLYPYRPTDEVLFWEEDPFQTAARGWFGTRPSLAVARAAIVKKGDQE